MALLRIVHAAGLPAPEDLLAMLSREGGGGAAAGPAPVAVTAPGPAAALATAGVAAAPEAAAPLALPADYPGLVALFEGRDPLLAHQLHDLVRLVRYDPPRLVLSAGPELPRDFAAMVRRRLKALAGLDLDILIEAGGGSSLREQQLARAAEARQAALDDPVVQGLLEAFPGSELLEMDADKGEAA
jgi:DNA polymerase-3 subunit gamma/tau